MAIAREQEPCLTCTAATRPGPRAAPGDGHSVRSNRKDRDAEKCTVTVAGRARDRTSPTRVTHRRSAAGTTPGRARDGRPRSARTRSPGAAPSSSSTCATATGQPASPGSTTTSGSGRSPASLGRAGPPVPARRHLRLGHRRARPARQGSAAAVPCGSSGPRSRARRRSTSPVPSRRRPATPGWATRATSAAMTLSRKSRRRCARTCWNPPGGNGSATPPLPGRPPGGRPARG